MITFIRPAHDGCVLRILSDRDDRMGANIKTQKDPMPNFRAIKISRKHKWYNTKNRNISFDYLKKTFLNQATPKLKISNPKKSFDRRSP